jgi:transposase InsO family protein
MTSYIDNHEEPVFYTFSYRYFLKKISLCRTSGIPDTLIHESHGKPREHQVKMTGQIKAYARLLLRNPRRFIINDILKKIKGKYKVDLSVSSIKRLKVSALDRNVLDYDADGKEWSRQNGLPKITRFLAEGAGDQFQGDWYKVQIYCLRNRIVIRLWAYVVLDVFSVKVVGWALADKPSATQAKEAFKMAFENSQFLPEEVIIDNDPIYLRKNFKRFIRKLNNLGIITTKAYPNIPTWKAEIESFFAVFQKLHSGKPWYIGEDIQSKNTAGNPADELRKELYRNKKSMLTEGELHKEFAKMVIEYNQITNDRRKTISPNDTFRLNPSKRVTMLQEWTVPLLFWKTKPKKRIKLDGRIDLQINRQEYCYQITQAETLWGYKNTDVRLCYDESDLSKVFVFERFTHKFIGMVEPRMVMTRDNKREVMKKQKQVLKDAQNYLREARQFDEDTVNNTNHDRKPISRESLADKQIRRQMKRNKLEKEVASVTIHP